jgi:hypothetical protein
MLNEWNHLLMDVVWVVVGIGAMYALHKMLMPHGDATKFFLSAEGIVIAAIIAPFAKHEINFRPSGVIEGPTKPGLTPGAIFTFFWSWLARSLFCTSTKSSFLKPPLIFNP